MPGRPWVQIIFRTRCEGEIGFFFFKFHTFCPGASRRMCLTWRNGFSNSCTYTLMICRYTLQRTERGKMEKFHCVGVWGNFTRGKRGNCDPGGAQSNFRGQTGEQREKKKSEPQMTLLCLPRLSCSPSLFTHHARPPSFESVDRFPGEDLCWQGKYFLNEMTNAEIIQPGLRRADSYSDATPTTSRLAC